MNSRLSALILLLLIPGFVTLDQLSVTCSQESICAVKGTEVTLTCSYSNINITTVFWFSEKQSTNWRKNNEPEDLTLDSDYSGRVKHQISNRYSTLTISDVRERDSGEYQLMFIMNDGVKHLRSAAVSLTVTGTQIKSSPSAVTDEEVILSCLTNCTLNDKHTYIWYKNGRQVTDGFTKVNKLYLDSVSNEELQQYSCAVGDAVNSTVFSHYTVTLLLFLPQFLIIAALWMWSISSVSFIVCVNLHKVKIMNSRLSALILLLLIPGFVTLDQLSVTCNQKSICAVKGSEVTLMCSYSNINIKTVFWFSEKQSTNWRKNNEPEDLTLDSDYSGRVKHQISYSSSTLTISDVRERDSGEYQLMFIMNDGVKHLRSAAVSLTVTDPTSPESSTALLITVIILSVLLILTLIGVLLYRSISSVSFIVCEFTQSEDHELQTLSADPAAAHSRENMDFRLLLILLLHFPGSLTLNLLNVTCGQQSICAVKGSEVTLTCFSSNINIKTVFWFSKKQSETWRKNNEPEDLTLDSDYSGRVKHQISSSSSTLTISDVKERDSGEYQLMFIMNDGVKHLRSAAVSLTVTDLHVRMNTASTYLTDDTVKLTCDTSCDLTFGPVYYYWLKHGQYFTYTDSPNMFVSISRDAGSFSCSHEDLKHCASSVCVSQSVCWVIHPSDHTVNKTFWHYGPTDGQSGIFSDLREEHQFAGHVEYVGNKLRIKELKISDSGEYRFRIITDLNQYSGSPGVILTVTGFVTLDQLSVTCSQESICAVKGTEVTLKCFYSNINITTVFWFSEKQSTNWRKNNEPEDLTLDSDYSGRVKHQISSSSSTLTISDVRERDSGEYQLMFIMNDGVKHLSSAAVSLTVTDLQVKMNPVSTDPTDESVQLTCDTSCTFTSGVWYFWMKDGQHFTYTQYRDISCTYSHPSAYILNKTFWHYGPFWDFKDLREEHQFAGRVEYVGNKLRIKDLKISDSGEYQFRIITDLDQYSGSPGVILTVTGTQINSSTSVVSEKDEVILSCSNNCTLKDKHTYIWHKNGRQVTDGFTKVNKLYLDSVSNEELQQYSCAVGDPVNSTVFSHYTVTLLLFLPQFLIIAALWMWSISSVSFIVCVNLHKVKIMNSRLSALILLLLIPGRAALCLLLYVNLHKVKIMNSRLSALILLLLIPDPVNSTVFSHYTVTLLVFLPQFLIIAALWMWYFIKIPFKSQTENKYDEESMIRLMLMNLMPPILLKLLYSPGLKYHILPL
ncbi:sialoadhesin-like isoform X1 [Labeo rohita]|uniref:Sialoadhesin-like isoform X1 n=1 Tax=Labeo rohita TaxID=84645 RepID=A0A498L438_LABRO|nr:sialoadhesin-like isoform X1 [Labeo rohita]